MQLSLHDATMDLTSPLRSLIPSLDSAVLEVLAGTESGLSATRIVDLARRGTRAGQMPVLNRLVEHGLVLAEPANTGHLYRLNRDHVLATAIVTAAGARQDVLRRLTNAVAALTPLPVHASVYGSFARGEADENSDIDLLIIVEDDVDDQAPTWLDQAHHLEDEVMTWTGNRLEPVVFTVTQFQHVISSRAPLGDSLRNEAVTIYGEALDGLTDTMQPQPGHTR